MRSIVTNSCIARGVVIPATEQTVSCGAVGPTVIAAALQGAGFMPRQTKERAAFVGRLAAWVVLHELAKYSSVQIGALTGHHHSTVLHALAVATKYAQNDRFKTACEAAKKAYSAAVG